MAPAVTRIERLAEATKMIKSLWDGGPLTHRGKHYDVVNAVGAPLPPQPFRTKWVLGGGGRRMLAVASAHADIISLGPKLAAGVKDNSFGASAGVERFAERVSWVRADTGDRFDDIELQCLVHACAITPDRDRYAARVLSRMFGLDPAAALASPMALVGTADQICHRLEELRERLAISYWVVPAAQMKPFADVVERLAGK
jgi:alkanesulfonate monooxygenase SsuD/methylene tetrahydromethanopterin reductase-like flavin-dependent oxidoreductase (luciferase family)